MRTRIKTILKLLLIVTISIAVVFCGSAGVSYLRSDTISVTRYANVSENIPEEFDGFKIAQLSDLHDRQFGEKQKDLLDRVRSLEPDLIVLTGDMVDNEASDLESFGALVRELSDIASVCYVSGNSEAGLSTYNRILETVAQNGGTVLENKTICCKRKYSTLSISGFSDKNLGLLKDQGFTTTKEANIFFAKLLDEISDCGTSDYNILLAHRPNLLQGYAMADFDLVLSGHYHGGQIRLPLYGAVYVPNELWFPKHTDGAYTEYGTTMFISRGLGNSDRLDVRLFNPPEIALITLKHKDV